MLERRRGQFAVATALFCVVLIEAFALRAHTLGVVLLAALAVIALVVVMAAADMTRIALGATYLCAFTITWNGWFVGPVRPGDVLVLLSIFCFSVGAPITVFRSPPWWVKQLALALVLGVVLFVLLPPTRAYLVHRVVLTATGTPAPLVTGNLAVKNIGIAAKFIVAVAAIPVAFTAAAIVDRRAVKRLAVAYCTGSALSGLVAFIDHIGIASLGHYLTHVPNEGERQLGFSLHPNFLAAGLVLAVPFACWMLQSDRYWEKRLGAASLLSQILGVYASGSRGGAVCALFAVILSFALLPRSRPHLPAILLASLAGAGIVAVVFPSVGLAILHATRLVGNPTTAGSDLVRAEVGAQGLADFRHSPIHGIGLQASTDASQVYYQELAAGGLVLFIAMSAYMLGAAFDSLRLINSDPLAAAILGSIGATLALNIFEADLTDRFYYVPEAILVAMLTLRRRAAAAESPPAAEQLALQPAAGRT